MVGEENLRLGTRSTLHKILPDEENVKVKQGQNARLKSVMRITSTPDYRNREILSREFFSILSFLYFINIFCDG